MLLCPALEPWSREEKRKKYDPQCKKVCSKWFSFFSKCQKCSKMLSRIECHSCTRKYGATLDRRSFEKRLGKIHVLVFMQIVFKIWKKIFSPRLRNQIRKYPDTFVRAVYSWSQFTDTWKETRAYEKGTVSWTYSMLLNLFTFFIPEA